MKVPRFPKEAPLHFRADENGTADDAHHPDGAGKALATA
jgi:hypothetical protein